VLLLSPDSDLIILLSGVIDLILKRNWSFALSRSYVIMINVIWLLKIVRRVW